MTVPEAVPGLLRLACSGLGLMATTGCVGVVNVTFAADVAVLPAESVTVTCQVSVKLSPQLRLALIDGLGTVLFDTELRVPAVRTQLYV